MKCFQYVNSVSGLCLHLRDTASVVIELGLEVEALEEPWYVSYLLGIRARIGVTPQSQGFVDNPSTRGIVVDVRLSDTTHENRAESPLYEELYPRYITCLKHQYHEYKGPLGPIKQYS